MKVNELINHLDHKFPLFLQEDYDNSGEQISFHNTDIKGILLSLDLDTLVIDEAIEKGTNLIITHHPFFFKPLRRITPGDPSSELLLLLIEKKISVYSAHTNLDKVYFDKLGELLGIKNRKLLIKTDHDEVPESEEYGFGVYGEFPRALLLKEILNTVKHRLNLKFVIYSGNEESIIKTIAIVGGSGGGMIETILDEHDVQCIITGDIGYHPCKIALNYGVPVIDAGHFGTEKILLNFLKDEINVYLTKVKNSYDVRVFLSKKEENPFKIHIT